MPLRSSAQMGSGTQSQRNQRRGLHRLQGLAFRQQQHTLRIHNNSWHLRLLRSWKIPSHLDHHQLPELRSQHVLAPRIHWQLCLLALYCWQLLCCSCLCMHHLRQWLLPGQHQHCPVFVPAVPARHLLQQGTCAQHSLRPVQHWHILQHNSGNHLLVVQFQSSSSNGLGLLHYLSPRDECKQQKHLRILPCGHLLPVWHHVHKLSCWQLLYDSQCYLVHAMLAWNILRHSGSQLFHSLLAVQCGQVFSCPCGKLFICVLELPSRHLLSIRRRQLLFHVPSLLARHLFFISRRHFQQHLLCVPGGHLLHIHSSKQQQPLPCMPSGNPQPRERLHLVPSLQRQHVRRSSRSQRMHSLRLRQVLCHRVVCVPRLHPRHLHLQRRICICLQPVGSHDAAPRHLRGRLHDWRRRRRRQRARLGRRRRSRLVRVCQRNAAPCRHLQCLRGRWRCTWPARLVHQHHAGQRHWHLRDTRSHRRRLRWHVLLCSVQQRIRVRWRWRRHDWQPHWLQSNFRSALLHYITIPFL